MDRYIRTDNESIDNRDLMDAITRFEESELEIIIKADVRNGIMIFLTWDNFQVNQYVTSVYRFLNTHKNFREIIRRLKYDSLI